MREPARLCHHEIEMVAMHHEIAFAVGAGMDRAFGDFDTAEMRAVIAAQEFVVIAGT